MNVSRESPGLGMRLVFLLVASCCGRKRIERWALALAEVLALANFVPLTSEEVRI